MCTKDIKVRKPSPQNNNKRKKKMKRKGKHIRKVKYNIKEVLNICFYNIFITQKNFIL